MCYGDIDYGSDGYYRQWAESQMREPQGPMCEICGEYEAVASANGYDVCSEACDHEANTRTPPASNPTPDGHPEEAK